MQSGCEWKNNCAVAVLIVHSISTILRRTPNEREKYQSWAQSNIRIRPGGGAMRCWLSCWFADSWLAAGSGSSIAVKLQPEEVQGTWTSTRRRVIVRGATSVTLPPTPLYVIDVCPRMEVVCQG